MKRWLKFFSTPYKQKLSNSNLEKEYDFIINIYEKCGEIEYMKNDPKNALDEIKEGPE